MKEEIIGKQEAKEKVHTLIETTIEHNNNFSTLVGIKYSEGSYKNYRTSLKHFKEFVPLFYKKKDIPLSLVNFKFCEAFFIWLTTNKTLIAFIVPLLVPALLIFEDYMKIHKGNERLLPT